MEGLEDAFAAADAEIAAVAALGQAALEAASGQEARLNEALSLPAVPLGSAAAERAAAQAEAAWLEALPKACAAVASVLGAAKAFYAPSVPGPSDAAPRKGLLGLLRRKGTRAAQAEDSPRPALAQAAFAGRQARLRAAFGMVDEALAHVAERRPFLDEQAYRFQKAALSAARGKGAPEEAARAAFPAEEMATVLSDHSSALALFARVLEAVDRSLPESGDEDAAADAAEAALDRILEKETGPA